jgi:hypothetical protein
LIREKESICRCWFGSWSTWKRSASTQTGNAVAFLLLCISRLIEGSRELLDSKRLNWRRFTEHKGEVKGEREREREQGKCHVTKAQ